jgi:RNA polymerase sigma factor (sigma-70 family)
MKVEVPTDRENMMAQPPLSLLLKQLRTARPDERPDAELLTRLARGRDADALQALIARHAPLVHGVCRRLLGAADAEDVLQATFLILVRRAPRLRPGGSLGSWMHTVAYRLALRVRAARRPQGLDSGREPQGGRDPLDEISGRELCAVIDEELQRLPERYRGPILLCCLEGKSREEAGQELGWPEGSVKARLQRGRALLRRRLERRGLTLPAVLLAPLLGGAPAQAAASLPEARALLVGEGAALSAGAVRLAEMALPGLFPGPLRALVWLALLLALAAAGAGLAWASLQPQAPPSPAAPAALPGGGERPAKSAEKQAAPLPAGVIRRFGSLLLWHSGWSWPVRFSADGKRLVTRGGDDALREWDLRTGRRVWAREIPGMHKSVLLAPGGKFASRIDRDRIVVLDSRTGKEVGRVATPGLNSARQVTADGKFLLVQVWDGKTVQGQVGGNRFVLWELATGKKADEFPAPLVTTAPVLSADRKRLALITRDQLNDTVRLSVHELPGGKELFAARGLSPVVTFGFAPDGRTLVSSHVRKFTTDNKWLPGGVRIWDVATGQLLHHLRPGDGGQLAVGFSPDGKLLAVGAYNVPGSPGRKLAIQLFDPATGREVRALPTERVPSGPFVFSPDGKTLAVGSREGAVRLYDLTAGKEVSSGERPMGMVSWCGFAPDGRTLASLSDDQTLRLWDVRTGKLLRTAPVERKLRQRVYPSNPVAFAPDGKTLVLTTDDRYFHIFDAATLKELRAWGPVSSYGHPVALACSPDGKRLAAANYGGQLPIWDPATGLRLRVLGARQSGQIHDLAYTPGGKQIALLSSDFNALGGRNRWVELWDAETGKEVWKKGTDIRSPYALAVSPDGRLVAAGGGDGTLELYELTTGALLRWGKGPNKDYLTGLKFSPDGRLLACVSRDRWLWFVDLVAGKDVLQTQGHEKGMTAVSFAPDGRAVATASVDGTILLWSAPAAPRPGKPAPLTEDELTAAWEQLKEAGKGEETLKAVRQLAGAGEQTLALLRKHYARPATAAPEAVARLVADLRHKKFAVRQKASDELLRLGPYAEPALRRALEGKPEEEVRRRVQDLLAKMERPDDPQPLGEALRAWRAVWVAERVGTAAARALLREWADRSRSVRLTAEARAALRRLRD